MGKPVPFNGIAQGLDNVILAQNMVKSQGAVFSGKNLITGIHGANCRMRWRFVNLF
jgi:hypothetical protein